MSHSKTFVGVVWTACQRFGTMIVAFATNMVLARLLSPKDFGTVGMLLFFLAISQVLIDSGLASALIQKKNTTNRDYSTVFILNMSLSLLLYLVLFFCAPLIADFYGIPILTPLLRVEGLVLIANALNIVQSAILRKKMDFKRLAVANLVANTVASVAAIAAAYFGMGVWSLVLRVILVSFLTTFMVWRVGEWRPRAEFDRQAAKGLFGYGSFMMLSTTLNSIGSNIQTLVIGKIFKQDILGLYTQALSLRNVAADSLQNIIGQVLFSDYSALNSDAEIADKLNRSFYIIAYFTTALLVLLIAVGEPLVVLLYSDKWIDCVPYFQILCVGGIFYAIQDVNYFVIAAKGRSKALFLINAIKVPLLIAALAITGRLFGIYGLLWCINAYYVLAYLMFAGVATWLLRVSISTQLLNLLKCIACSLAGLAAIYIFKELCSPSNLWLQLILYSAVYVLTVGALSLAFRMTPLLYILRMLRRVK